MTAPWPDVVWNASLLRPLDARSRGEIAAAGRLRTLRAGEVVHRAGDPADVLYVVVRGACDLEGRRVEGGEVFGEEATIASFPTRAGTARAATDSVVAEVPLVVLRRGAARSGGTELLSRTERSLRRAATMTLVRAARPGLASTSLAAIVDGARHVHVGRGESIEGRDEVFLVAAGLVGGVGRGDTVDAGAIADGPSWLVAFPRGLFPSAPRRLPVVGKELADPYRLHVARSLLVIDQDSCLRCGHCAWSCADTHDGVSRLLRHGEVVTGLLAERGPQLVPNSCQHCTSPGCMVDCPTGAIERDARGEVVIREELCTGCGSCAKACPWDNIQLAPRATGSALVAVKCDLCGGDPACVAACPTEAAIRVEPRTIAGALGGSEPLPRRMPAWPWLVGGMIGATRLARLRVGAWPSGVACGLALVLLAGYAVAKRRRWLRGPVGYRGHLALGALAAGLVLAHAQRLAGSGGALAIVFALAVATGLLGFVVGVLVPRALTRCERSALLPEALAARPRAIDEAIFRALSGKAESVKTDYAAKLGPYRAARLGPLALLVSRRTLAEEEARLAREVGPDTRALVELVVEHRGVRLQRGLTFALRAWLAPHVVLTAAALVLLAVHVFMVVR